MRRSPAGNAFPVEASFDANLSAKLVSRLADLFPGSAHVFGTGLERFAADEEIRKYAAAHGYVVVTADRDFIGMAETMGPPPRVVHLENCNYKTALVEKLLRRNSIRIADLEASDRSVLTIRNVA